MKYLEIMRPAHWSKNLFIFAAIVFGRRLFGPANQVILDVLSVLAGFFCFSMASAAVYIFNDIIDRQTDRLHPEKAKRPLAAGTVTVFSASILALFCAAVAVICSLLLVRAFAVLILCYIVLTVVYSLLLKRVMILDVITISIGFVLRAMAGAVIVGVLISPWLIICTFMLCLFIGFGKRRSEIALLDQNSQAFRATLAGYTPELLSHMLDVTSGLAIASFLLYSMDERTIHSLGSNNLFYTTPFVLFCIFRFSLLIQKGKYTGPVRILLHDLPFQIGLVLWGLACIAIVYADKLGIGFGILAY